MSISSATIRSILAAVSSIPMPIDEDRFMQQVVQIIDQQLEFDTVGSSGFRQVSRWLSCELGQG